MQQQGWIKLYRKTVMEDAERLDPYTFKLRWILASMASFTDREHSKKDEVRTTLSELQDLLTHRDSERKCSTSTVKKCLNTLKELGYIEEVSSKSGVGRVLLMKREEHVGCERTSDKEESPIETVLGSELDKMADNLGGDYTVERQVVIKVGGKEYRADFVVTRLCDNASCKVVVECDGHNFHEKTREQAARDKKRDRDMQKQGYIVMRFTGSEIWTSAENCAREVFNMVSSRTA